MIRAVLRLLSLLPLRVLHGLGSVAGSLMYYLPSRSRKITLKNLELCFPEMSETQRRSLALASLKETGKTACELGLIWCRPVEEVMKHVVTVHGKDLIEQHLADGKGLIIIAPHLGSWELSGLYVSTVAPITFLYRPPRMEAFEKALTGFRSRAGAAQAPTTPRGIMQLVKTVRAGNIAGILPDQQPGYDSGVFAPFFHEKALTMTLVARLAQKTGAPVISCVARRLPKGQGFEILLRPVDPQIDSDDPLEAATALNRSVETVLLDDPAQYQWEYKRFRRRPRGDNTRIYG